MRRYIYLGVFFSGMTSLAIELSASRLLGNYFGSSNLVWASIIGLVLIYLTIGYTLGGKLADQYPQIERFFGILAWAALLIGVIPLVSRPILRFSSQAFDFMQIGPLFGSFISVLILFSAPVILLGTASPFAIRLAMKDKASSGSLSGRIYAISTLGSFIGTFLPVLWLIPAIGTYRTFVTLSAGLLAVALLGLWKTGSAKTVFKYLWMPILLIILTLIGLSGLDKTAQGLIYETESAYNYIQVQEIEGMRYLRLNEGQGIHSMYKEGESNYHGAWEYVLVAPFINPNACNLNAIKKIALIGLAAGTSAKEAIAVFPQVEVDGYEIDPEVAEVGKLYFAMQDPKLNVILEDGRWGLAKSKNRYEVINIDAYRPPYIPWQLTTLEFFLEVRGKMTADGVVVLNIVRVGDNRQVVNSLVMTLKQVFPTVMVTDIPGYFNSIVFASVQSTDVLSVVNNFQCLAQKSSTPQVVLDVLTTTLINIQPEPTDGIIYTDDRAPVEWQTNQMLLDFIFSGKTKELQ
jgi:predicted membrane-bound spermidine synthase